MEKLKQLLQSKKAYRLIAGIGIAGIIAVFLSEIMPKSTPENTVSKTVCEQDSKADIEQQIVKIVKEISGDETPSVAVMLESGTEYIYATARDTDTAKKNNQTGTENYNSETSDKNKEEYIIINNGSCEQPLLLATKEPTVRGVAVVCDNADNPEIRESIVKAVCTLFDISQRDIEVCKRNNVK